MQKLLIEIRPDKIDLLACHQFLFDPKSGGVVTFVGTVRDFSRDRRVTSLEFEAYEEMALPLMYKIAEKAIEDWKLSKAVLVHVIGKKEVMEPIVFTGAASVHREEAFQAARFLIDELKRSVPIWKKEYYKDESFWVNSTP